MRRFVSHRGKPDLIISDNATQFKLVNTALDKQWRKMFIDKYVLNYVVMEGIKWSYTTALAPCFMKGFWNGEKIIKKSSWKVAFHIGTIGNFVN